MPNTMRVKRNVAQKVLIVEDEGEMGLVLDMVLAERKFHLDFVKTISAAEEYLLKQQPSVILLDNQLPDGFGVDFITYLKKVYPSIKIIMISGFGTARDVALENGADLFFEKPFSLSEFDAALNRLLQYDKLEPGL